jgi:hypothetical protein
VPSIPLTVATGPYDSTRALFDGSVGIEGAAVTMRTGRTLPEIFERMMRQREFDVAELGGTFYLREFSPDSPYLALPVFPNRVFRHSCVFGVRGGTAPKSPWFLACEFVLAEAGA